MCRILLAICLHTLGDVYWIDRAKAIQKIASHPIIVPKLWPALHDNGNEVKEIKKESSLEEDEVLEDVAVKHHNTGRE